MLKGVIMENLDNNVVETVPFEDLVETTVTEPVEASIIPTETYDQEIETYDNPNVVEISTSKVALAGAGIAAVAAVAVNEHKNHTIKKTCGKIATWTGSKLNALGDKLSKDKKAEDKDSETAEETVSEEVEAVEAEVVSENKAIDKASKTK